MEKKEVFEIAKEVCTGWLDGSLGGSGADMSALNVNLVFIPQVNWCQLEISERALNIQIIGDFGPNSHVMMLQLEIKVAGKVFLSSPSDEQTLQTEFLHLCLCSC